MFLFWRSAGRRHYIHKYKWSGSPAAPDMGVKEMPVDAPQSTSGCHPDIGQGCKSRHM